MAIKERLVRKEYIISIHFVVLRDNTRLKKKILSNLFTRFQFCNSNFCNSKGYFEIIFQNTTIRIGQIIHFESKLPTIL